MCGQQFSESGKLCGITPCQEFEQLQAKIVGLEGRILGYQDVLKEFGTERSQLTSIKDAARPLCASWEQYQHSGDPAMLPAVKRGMEKLIAALDAYDAGQIKYRVGSDTMDGGTLFSENLY